MNNLNIYNPPTDDDNFKTEDPAVKYAPPETPASSRYMGFGIVHLAPNDKKHWTWDSDFYSLRVQSPAGKFVDLLLSNEELEKALQRALAHPKDVVRPRGWIQTILSGEISRLWS